MKRQVSACLIVVVLLVSLTVTLSFKWVRDDGEASIQANRSTWNNETNASSDSENLSQAEFCVLQWQQDLFTMEETLRCIDENMETTSG